MVSKAQVLSASSPDLRDIIILHASGVPGEEGTVMQPLCSHRVCGLHIHYAADWVSIFTTHILNTAVGGFIPWVFLYCQLNTVAICMKIAVVFPFRFSSSSKTRRTLVIYITFVLDICGIMLTNKEFLVLYVLTDLHYVWKGDLRFSQLPLAENTQGLIGSGLAFYHLLVSFMY